MPERVLFLHPSAGGYGADRQLRLLVDGLDRSRFVPFAVLGEEGPLAEHLRATDVPVEVRPLAVLRRTLTRGRGAGRTATALAADVRAVGAIARRQEVAIVHTNTSTVLCGQAVAQAAGSAHVLHVREIYPGAGPALLWPLLRRRLGRADALLCVSGAVAAQFGAASHAHVLHDALAAAPVRGARAEARAALRLPTETFVVALVGRLSDWKGQHVVIRALAEPSLAGRGAIALLAGDPAPGQESHREALVHLADELGVASRTRLLGFRDDLGTILGAADAVAVPSVHPDPFPNVALEAAAAGMPIVASSSGGLPEIVRDGLGGRLVAPGDHVALAAALDRFASAPDEARALGEAAAADVRARFAPARLLEGLHGHYEDLLRARGGAQGR